MIPSDKLLGVNKVIKFGIIADVQYSSLNTHNPDVRPAPQGIKKVSDAISILNKLDLDFVINLGDLIDRDAQNFPKILEAINASRAPVWHMLGNHDFCGPEYDYGHKKEALSALNLSDQTRYYFKDIEPYRFMMLDTNELGTIEQLPGSPEWVAGQNYLNDMKAKGKLNAEPWNGGVGKTQIKWLTKAIEDAQDQQLSCIVFGHHPIYPKHRENLLNEQQIANLLSSYPSVKIYISGHNHHGNFGRYKGLPCWTIEGMMDFKDKTAFADIKIYNNKLVINGHGRVKSRTLDLR